VLAASWEHQGDAAMNKSSGFSVQRSPIDDSFSLNLNCHWSRCSDDETTGRCPPSSNTSNESTQLKPNSCDFKWKMMRIITAVTMEAQLN